MESHVHRLAGQAARQHGVFTHDQARRSGVGDDALRQLVRSGWCRRPAPGIYIVRAASGTHLQDVLVRVLSAGPDAVASHRTAADLWGVPGHRTAPVEITRALGLGQRSRLAVIHISKQLPPSHVVVRQGIPVTTAARTAFDLAGVVPAARLERDIDDLLHRKVCTLGQVQQVFFLLARRGRRGTAAMRSLLDDFGEGHIAPASELERKARKVFAAAGLPPPRFEVHLGTDDLWVGRVDCLWDDARLVVELDGGRIHGSMLARDADRRRDNHLMSQGWRVIRITWDDLCERPDEVVAWIRAAIAR